MKCVKCDSGLLDSPFLRTKSVDEQLGKWCQNCNISYQGNWRCSHPCGPLGGSCNSVLDSNFACGQSLKHTIHLSGPMYDADIHVIFYNHSPSFPRSRRLATRSLCPRSSSPVLMQRMPAFQTPKKDASIRGVPGAPVKSRANRVPIDDAVPIDAF
jgi:hypothetical protein